MPNKTLTQVPVTVLEIDQLQVVRDSTDEAGNTLACVVGYHVLLDTGAVLKTGSVRIPLTASQQTAFRNLIINVVVPAINTQEGT